MKILKVKSLEWYDILIIDNNTVTRSTNNDKGKFELRNGLLSIFWDVWGEEKFICMGNDEYYKENFYNYIVNIESDVNFDEAELNAKDKVICLKNLKRVGKYKFEENRLEVTWKSNERQTFYMYNYGKTFSTKINSQESYKKKIIKNIAIVFPQYHEIPENNKFWGKGFTEWTLLKKMPDKLENQVIKRPHEDIGYYNLKNIEHRKLMEKIAVNHEIHGFCFYHYWFKNKKIMYEPLELMIEEGHPNLPFMLCWANEQWTKRWDGGNNEILLEQDYDDYEGNINHFNYLLTFFKHKNYIKIKNKPIFIFYRIEKKDVSSLEKIIIEWNKLAIDNGFCGIHFMRFYGPFDNKVELKGIEGFINFEPGYTTQIYGNDIISYNENNLMFNNAEDYNEEDYLNKNVDVAEYIKNKVINSGFTHYKSICEKERLIRTTKFNVHDGDITLQKIKTNTVSKKNHHLGIFVGWNNFPRRNYKNKKYSTYPLYYKNMNCKKFGETYEQLLNNINNTSNNDTNFLFITSWNEWNEQSSLEPNHYDGYNYLLEIKKRYHANYKLLSKKKILIISHKGGGTEKYINDLKEIFNNYEFVFYDENVPVDIYQDVDFVHINSFFTLKIMDNYIDFLKTNFKDKKKIITIHDYQWLFPDDPNILSYNMKSRELDYSKINQMLELINMCESVIFPSYNILKNYDEFLNLKNIKNKIVVTPHCDKMVFHQNLRIADLDEYINIAYVGNFIEYKGSTLYRYLYNNVKYYNGKKLRYHVFGYMSDDEKERRILDDNFIYHDQYDDTNIIKLLYENNIHIITHLSLFEESYCYALTNSINSGIPILYIEHGAFTERLIKSERYFASSVSNLTNVFQQALIYVCLNKDNTNIYNVNEKLQPSKWYLINY